MTHVRNPSVKVFQLLYCVISIIYQFLLLTLPNTICWFNLLQVHCDFNRRITNVDARWPGSVNDAYSFNSSPVGDQCKAGDDKEEGGPLGKFLILGDSG